MANSVKSIRISAVGAVLVVLVSMVLLVFGFNRVDEYEVSVRRNPVTGAVAPMAFSQGLYHSILRAWTSFPLREVQYPEQGRSERLSALTSGPTRNRS